MSINPHDLQDLLLQKSTLHISADDGPHTGTGFFVAPQHAITSANLVGRLRRRAGVSELLPTSGAISVLYEQQRSTARIVKFVPELDLALLRVEVASHACIFIKETFDQSARLSCFGFSPGEKAGRVCFPTITGWDEPRQHIDLILPDATALTAFTGAALLNRQTGGVCGMVIGAKAIDRDWLDERRKLLAFIIEHFSKPELEELCFEFDLSTESLPHANEGKPVLALEVLRLLDTKGQLENLKAKVIELRPKAPFAFTVEQLPDETLQRAQRLIEDAYRNRLARGLTMKAVLDLQAPDFIDLAAAQRAFHTVDTRWIDTIQRKGAGRCYPDEVGPPKECPYPGLLPFESDTYFRGRDDDITWFRQVIVEPDLRLLVLSGASGRGKSSLVRVGLLPEALAIPDVHVASSAVLRLDDQPTKRLMTALELDDDSPAQLGPAINALLERHAKQRAVLLIDQFEEVLYPISIQDPTSKAAEDDRQRALRLVQNLRKDEALPVTLLLVVRPEGIAALQAAGLDAFGDLHRDLEPLGENGLREAIQFPAQAFGVDIEQALVDRLVLEAGDWLSRSPLPLLQVALRSMWSTMRGRRLTLAAYKTQVVRLSLAIQRRADIIFDRLSPQQRLVARAMVLRLIALQEPEDARRPQPQTRLVSVSSEPQITNTTLKTLVDEGLVTTFNYRGTTWVDLSHEALIRDWSKLRDEWLSRAEPPAGQPNLRRCEAERRRWEGWVENWQQQGDQFLTSEESIAEAAQWNGACGLHLGPVPGLDELVKASLAQKLIQRRRFWTIVVTLVFIFMFGIFTIYIFFAPILPHW